LEIQLRLAITGDIPALRALIPASVRALSAGYYTPRQIDLALIDVFGVDTQLINDGTYVVAECDGQLVGAGGWGKRKTLYGGDHGKSADEPLLDPASEPARIRAFYVHPDWARRGIGRRIMRACEEAARAAGFTRLELAATVPGEPLYRAMGYRVTERIQIPLPDGESLPCALMDKVLA
jgi:GNAT superfamily N-acetyltransferase